MAETAEVRLTFPDSGRQRDAAVVGMYVFLATEVMLFGALLLAILVVRALHPHDFVEASKKTQLAIGAINTALLLTSSFMVAAAVAVGRAGRTRVSAWLLLGAAALGTGFLGLKGLEYALEARMGLLPVLRETARFADPVEHLFMDLYLVSTALHAFHLAIGIALLLAIAFRLWRAPNCPAILLHNGGLYWHFVDCVWVFLFPLLYLAR